MNDCGGLAVGSLEETKVRVRVRVREKLGKVGNATNVRVREKAAKARVWRAECREAMTRGE